MKKCILFAAIAVTIAVSFSCQKEKNMPREEALEQNESAILGRPVTLTFNLEPETKMTHVYEEDGGKWYLKSKWVKGDCLKLVHGTTTEYFVLDGDETTASGNFTCASSTLSDSEEYTVTYYKNNRSVASESTDCEANYGTNADWSVQDGTKENLPEVLTGTATFPASATLHSALTFFHIVGTVPAEADGQTFTHGYFRQTGGSFKLLNKTSALESSFIKIVPPSAYVLTSGATLDLYVAAIIEGDTNGGGENGLEFRLMNADYDDANTNDFTNSLQSCAVAWTPSTTNNYISGKVYKKADTFAYNTGLVGAENNTTAFWSAWSDAYSIAPGKVLEQTFVNNHADAETNTYFNWTLAISNDVVRGGDGYAEYLLLLPNTEKCRNNDFPQYYVDVDYSAWSVKLNGGDVDWDSFNTIMNGATVTMRIEHTNAGSLFITVTAKKGTDTIVTTYSQAVSGTESIRAFLTCDHNHYIMQSAAISNSTKTVNSLSTSPCYLYTRNIPLSTIGVMNQLRATYNDNSVAYVDPALLTDYGSGTVTGFTAGDAAGAMSNQDFAVTFKGESKTLTVTKIKGTGELGSIPYSADFNREQKINLASGTSSEIRKMYVYSAVENARCAPQVYLEYGADRHIRITMDNYYEDATGFSYDPWSAGNFDNDWVWSIFNKFQHHSKVSVQVVNTPSNGATVKYGVQYEVPNTLSSRGYRHDKMMNIPISSGTWFHYAIGYYKCYIVFVDPSTEGWPALP